MNVLDANTLRKVRAVAFSWRGGAFAPDGITAYAPIPSEDAVAVLWFGKP